jgi:hypothetical protein
MPRPEASAKPQDTYDHIFGSGFETWDWWRKIEELTGTEDGNHVTADYMIQVTIEDPKHEDAELVMAFGHDRIIESCWKIILDVPKYMGPDCVRNCGALLFNADDADFDAASADELVQYIMLGSVEYC